MGAVMNRLRVGARRRQDDAERGGSQETDWMCHQRSPFTRPIVNQTLLTHAPMCKKSKCSVQLIKRLLRQKVATG
jgi:hypothetical protein